VMPRFRDAVLSPMARDLDFGSDTTPGVEIGEELGRVVLRKVVLAGQEAADDGSSPW